MRSLGHLHIGASATQDGRNHFQGIKSTPICQINDEKTDIGASVRQNTDDGSA
jgi:hypothetical protein